MSTKLIKKLSKTLNWNECKTVYTLQWIASTHTLTQDLRVSASEKENDVIMHSSKHRFKRRILICAYIHRHTGTIVNVIYAYWHTNMARRTTRERIQKMGERWNTQVWAMDQFVFVLLCFILCFSLSSSFSLAHSIASRASYSTGWWWYATYNSTKPLMNHNNKKY